MPTRIADYYNELQRREGLEPVELVAEWEQRDSEAISTAFRRAFAESRITEQTIPIFGLMCVLAAVIRIRS